ncbi:TIGR01244 family sulfur transferase [Neisseria montereyensis]|uniref:TIGR01244 family sulfur transferase n=1 Tax=Neisseria montereyensis TaxID=2973938 RepID=A0ABT2FAJ7_9NEIS|nr:TIGR01244 family sulfur transferase [Neisseria montereyensis]MCS4532769.1 TIGR01244 family sulfur transferase [Neisseria montereyensis]
MTIRRLTDKIYIASQLTHASVAEAVALGIKSVFCNRPDGEAADQTSAEQMKQWFAEAGINQFIYLPVTAPTINAEVAAEFRSHLTDAEVPVLAYCLTGTRSSLLWAYGAVANGMAVADAMAMARNAGVDLSSFEGRLQEAAAKGA